MLQHDFFAHVENIKTDVSLSPLMRPLLRPDGRDGFRARFFHGAPDRIEKATPRPAETRRSFAGARFSWLHHLALILGVMTAMAVSPAEMEKGCARPVR